jgi:succinoglycan biosynthesis transport protein ExoP
LSLLAYLRVVRSRWLVALTVLALTLSVIGGWTLLTPRTYTARAAVVVSVNLPGGSNSLKKSYDYATGLARLAVGLANSPVVLDPVINRLGLATTRDELANTVHGRVELDTVVVELTADASTPERATAVADAVAAELVTTIDRLVRADGRTRGAFGVSVTSPAGSRITTSPRVMLNMGLALVLGTLLGAFAAIAAADRDSARGRTGFTALTPAPVLGVLRRPRRWWSWRRRTREEQIGEVCSGFLRLRRTDQVRSVMVTATTDTRVGSLTVRDLGESLAERDLSVLIVDADLAGASLNRGYRLPAATGGLCGVLAGATGWETQVRSPVPKAPLWLLPAGGPTPVDPGVALASARMAELLQRAAAEFDVVLVHAPPVGAVSDGLALAPLVDGVIVVADVSGRGTLAVEIEALRRVNAVVTGIVLGHGGRRWLPSRVAAAART